MQNETALLDRLEEATEVIRSVDWRLYEVQVIPIRSACDDNSGKLKQKPL